MKGRKPKPLALRRADGDVIRAAGREPQPAGGAPSCPAWLASEAKVEWRRVLKAMAPTGLLTQADRAVLAVYCQSWADYLSAKRAIQAEGEVFTTPKRFIAKNPWLTILNEAAARLMKAAVELGLTPVSRTRLAMERPEPAAAKLDDFVAQLRPSRPKRGDGRGA